MLESGRTVCCWPTSTRVPALVSMVPVSSIFVTRDISTTAAVRHAFRARKTVIMTAAAQSILVSLVRIRIRFITRVRGRGRT
tara:strand:- start:435 stop:680 length:246 start_codon:yes stop_codon:yes gene_type:complete